MKTKTKGALFIVLGIAGAVFVSIFDIIAGKPENMIGPKSIGALVICGLLIIRGAAFLLKKPKA